MPLVHIHLVKGSRTSKEIRQVADIIQEVMLSTFNVPPNDRLQIITQHQPGELICEGTALGFVHTHSLIVVHVLHKPRSTVTKQAMYSQLMTKLAEKTGLKGGDLIVSCSSNMEEDWSFGLGRAQYLTGEL